MRRASLGTPFFFGLFRGSLGRGPRCVALGQHTGRIPLDHVIGRLPLASITDGVVDIGGLEDNGAWSEFHPVASDQGLNGTLLHDEQFFISVLVGRVRRRSEERRVGKECRL